MRFLLHLSAVTAGLLIPQLVGAQVLDPCPIPILPCQEGGSLGVQAYLLGTVFPAMRILLIGLALAHFFYYGIRMVVQSNSDDAIATNKSGYEYAIYGCALMSLSSFLVEAFGQGARDTLINTDPIAQGISNVMFYLKLIVSTLMTVTIAVVSFRLVVVQDEGEKEKAKKRLFLALFGVAAILLANAIALGVAPGVSSAGLADEIRGIANFMLEIFGALAVFWFIVTGIMLIVSVDEGQMEKGKKGMFSAAMAIVVVLSSYVLVNFFLTL